MAALAAGTRRPWVGLGAAVWVQIAAGNAFTFPLYSHSLKSVLGFNQKQLTMLGVANDIGENFGLIPGFLSKKHPPWLILLIGALACFFGYGIIWLTVSSTILPLPYWMLWIALCVAANSSAWFTTAVIVTNIKNFPLQRGIVAGILKGYAGLGAAVFTEIYRVLLGNSSSRLLLFLALGIPVLCFASMFFVRPCTPAPNEDPAESGRLDFIQVSSLVLGFYVLSTAIVDDNISLSAPIANTLFVVMVLLLMAPLAIPVKMTLYPTPAGELGMLGQAVGSPGSLNDEGGTAGITEPLLEPSGVVGSPGSLNDEEGTADITEPLLEPSGVVGSSGRLNEGHDSSDVPLLVAEGEGGVKEKRKLGEDFKFSEAVVTVDFWLLFFVFFFGVGSGVTVLNNLAQIGIAQGFDDTTFLLSLFGVGNFVGRLGGGFVSELFVRSKTIPRTVWMTCTQIIMFATYLLFASAINATFYPATGILGACYGVQFSVMISTVSELFGLKDIGTFYNFMALGNPLGALLFSGLLAGYVYDNEAAKQQGIHLHGTNVTCVGPNCFRLTFLVLAAVCFVGSILSIVLSLRIKPFYQNLFAGGSVGVLPDTNQQDQGAASAS
ncbi:protein NUCLEAR FUSION DEFECTIVE 4-like [Pyrus communis]|uniref:protein NUCLEAR FUSION DEFECTIVE 4-like n=1 Tax=Pyrus communis TaxID=23211 RepID=UPI0035C14D72